MRGKLAWPTVVAAAVVLSGVSTTTPASGEQVGIGQPITAIEFDCAAPIDRQGLQGMLPMQVGDPLREDDIEQARWRLNQTEIFTAVTIETRARGDGVAVLVHLVRKSVVDAVRFRGNHALSDEMLRRAARVQEGAAFSDQVRDYAVARIRERYAAEGFPEARVEANVRPRAAGDVRVTFDITEGTPQRVGAVEIAGQIPFPVDKIRRAAGIRPGDRYSRARQRAAATAIERWLRGKHYYEADVGATWQLGEDGTGVLRFTVDSGPPFLLRFEGNDHFSDAHLVGLMDLPRRPIVTDGTWRELARRAQRAYQEDGYYFARVDVHVQPGTPKVVRFDVDEGRVYHVAAVRFEGNRGLPGSLLRAQMATRPPSWVPWRWGVFLDEVFAEDLKRLWYLYRRYGFEDAQIVDTRTDFDQAHGALVVTVVIQEGRQTIVRAIEQVGVEPIAAARPPLQVAVGEPLDPEKLEADRQTLISTFTKAGYARAEVTTAVETEARGETDAATVRFVAVPGPVQHVGVIIVQNDFDTRWRVIERELPFRADTVLDPDALLRGQTNLFKLGLFRSVTVRPLEHDAQASTRDVAVSVSEKPAGTFLWGAGYNTRDGFRGFGEVSYANLQGLGRRISLRGEASLAPPTFNTGDYSANLGFREPRLGTSEWSLRVNLVAQRTTTLIYPYSLERIALIPGIERSWFSNLRGGFEVQADESNVFDVKPDVLAFNPRDQGRLTTVGLAPYVVYDGRDDAFVPHRGVFESLRVRYAPALLGSQIPFFKFVAQHTHYLPLTENLTFVYAARGGWGRALESGMLVPIQDRFFLGGSTTVRGFEENAIGPTGSTVVNSVGQVQSSGNPVGGEMALNLNAELRFPLLYGVGGVVFVDGGGVYVHTLPVSIHDFRRSTGPALSYITPVGAVSVEYGFKLDRRAGESLGEVGFSIGNIF